MKTIVAYLRKFFVCYEGDPESHTLANSIPSLEARKLVRMHSSPATFELFKVYKRGAADCEGRVGGVAHVQRLLENLSNLGRQNVLVTSWAQQKYLGLPPCLLEAHEKQQKMKTTESAI